MGEKENILLIEKLITDNDFDKLKDYFKDINIFKVMGIDQNEIRHSNTIAWFLDPFKNHNLGSLFFQKFMSYMFEKDPDYFNDRNINILHLLLTDIDDMKVFREKEDIDILVVSKKLKFVICIENKINAGIGDTQLDKYYKYINEHYSSFSKFFLLLSPAGYEVPVDKSENPEAWISASYEDIVKILRSILELDIDQKVKYIIGDYIKLLEKENIVENVKLDEILSSLCAKHKDAIDLLLKYQESQPAIRRLREVIKETFLEYDKTKKIICNKNSLDTFRLVFYTTNMNKYFQPVDDKSGSWSEGTKYRYWIYLRDKSPCLVFELGPLEQDDDTIKKMNLIRKSVKLKEVTASAKYRQTKFWDINIDWTYDSLENMNDEHMRLEIRKTLDEILQWEETEVKNILK
jgi:hypothetical protein